MLFAIYDLMHGTTGYKGSGYANWELYTAGLAFTIALSGLGWTECGNDYTRYLPRDASKKVGRGMDLHLDRRAGDLHDDPGRPRRLRSSTPPSSSPAWNGANPFEALHGQTFIPSWVIVLVLAVRHCATLRH